MNHPYFDFVKSGNNNRNLHMYAIISASNQDIYQVHTIKYFKLKAVKLIIKLPKGE
jgi:hypothetical protein